MLTKRRKILFCSIILAFSAVVFVLLAELALRAKGSYLSWSEKNQFKYASPYLVLDSWYMTRIPNSKGKYDQLEFDFDCDTNSFGLRDQEWKQEKPTGVTRILALGDSFTEGQGAELKNSYPKILEDELRGEGYAVEVFNAGRAGSDPFFQYVLLRDKLLRLSPDVVLVMINTTDVNDVVRRGGMERFHKNGTVVPPRQPKTETLYEHSHLFRFINHNVLGRDSFFLTREQRDSLARDARPKLVEAAELFLALAAEHDFRFVAIIQPMPRQLRKSEPPMPTVAHLLSERGIAFVDAAPAMRKVISADQPVAQLFWKMDGHYNAGGYAALASAVRTGLHEQKVFQQPGNGGDKQDSPPPAVSIGSTN